jgi:hypothetical protein
VTFLVAGVCEITATQNGDSNWLPAPSMKQIVVVGKLLSKVAGPVQEPLLTPSETQSEEQSTSVTLPVEEGSEKKIIVTDEKSKKRRLKKTEPVPESKE